MGELFCSTDKGVDSTQKSLNPRLCPCFADKNYEGQPLNPMGWPSSGLIGILLRYEAALVPMRG